MKRTRATQLLLMVLILLLYTLVSPIGKIISQSGPNTGKGASLSIQDYVGIWQGTITDPAQVPYDTSIALVAGEVGAVIGAIAYPERHCGGEVTLLQVDSTAIKLLEDITYGSGCNDKGIITLTFVATDTINYMWSPDFAPGVATGPLTKVNTAGTDVPGEYIGVWRGSAVQQNPPSSWPILIALPNGSLNGIVGTSAYPSLECGGDLTLTQVNQQSIGLAETITYGSEDCGDTTITLEMMVNTLDVLSYTASLGPSRGTLERVMGGQAKITGHVQATTGDLLDNILVTVYKLTLANEWRYAGAATTVAGNYSIGGLGAGTYRVYFEDRSQTYLAEYYDDVSDFNQAQTITVPANAVVSAIDAVLGKSSASHTATPTPTPTPTPTETATPEPGTFLTPTPGTWIPPICSVEIVIIGGPIPHPQPRLEMTDLISLYRRFRDETLSASPTGQKFIALYDEHTTELAGILIADSDLRSRTAQFLENASDEFASLFNDATAEVILQQALYDEADALVKDLANAGSEDFRAEMLRTWSELALEQHIGQKTTDIWQELQHLRVYLPLMIRVED